MSEFEKIELKEQSKVAETNQISSELANMDLRISAKPQLQISKPGFAAPITLRQGFDILRLVSPAIEQFNDEFYCKICNNIVNQPLECANNECGALYCYYCLQTSASPTLACTMCQQSGQGYRQPSPMCLRILNSYLIKCETCQKPISMKEIMQHEILCQQSVCSNELCQVKLTEQMESKQQFTINNELFIACSKKCKKVTKFAHLLNQGNETEILCAFETMLRKKQNKKNQQNQQNNQQLQHMNNQRRTAFNTLDPAGLQAMQNGQGIQTVNQKNFKSLRESQTGNRPVDERKLVSRQMTQRQSLANNKFDTEIMSQAQLHFDRQRTGGPASAIMANANSRTMNNTALVPQLSSMIYPEDTHEFCWDPSNSSKEIHFSTDCRHAFLFEANYLFRTIIGSRPFMDGVHYWEIVADARTEHELKIGVSLQQKFAVNNAFCDYEFGFAYYGMGQLRHGSNSEGKKYGKPFKKKGVLGVCLDMEQGKLSFGLDGEYFGVAFEDSALRRGPIWPAISMLHLGGLTLISGLEKPQNYI